MEFPVEIEGSSIVLLGDINPAIFHPSWFLSQGLIAKPDFDSAEVELVTRELAVMNISGMRVIVQADRFQVESRAADMLGPARDLVLGAFKVLEHSPVRSMGLNHHAHYRVPTKDDWHAIGHKLVPKGIWADLLQGAGTRAVHVQGKRSDCSAESVTVQLEPSRKIPTGVYVGTNEHYAEGDLSEFLELLATEWEPSQRYARKLGPEILKRCFNEN